MLWWDSVVKKGIRQIAIQRGKEINRERRGELNLLFLRQSYLSRKLHGGLLGVLGEYKTIQLKITKWYDDE